MSRALQQVMHSTQQHSIQEHGIALRGGLNATGSTLEMSDGEALVLHNYEVNLTGNYQSFAGIERFDGQPAPSEVSVDRHLPGTDEDALTALIEAQQLRRDAIQAVPGSGPVRGVYYFAGVVLAFRDNEQGSAAHMFCSSESGWQQIETPPLQPGGRYQFTDIHFAGRKRELVGVDGVNHGFLWDGEVFTQIINPGMDAAQADRPLHVVGLPAEILLFSYASGSLQWSALGNPLSFDVAEGAGEIALADDITGLSLQAKDVTAVFCQKRTYLIRGRTPALWQVDSLYSDLGAIEGSVQSVGDTLFLNARGLTQLARIEQFGDFRSRALSDRVHRLMVSAMNQVACSVTVQQKSQYRLFLTTGAGLCATMIGDEVAFTQFDYGTDKALFTVVSAQSSARKERLFAGGCDGFVYELDCGTSLDGKPIQTILRSAYSPLAMRGVRKRLNRLVVELKAGTSIDVRASLSIDFEDMALPASLTFEERVLGVGAYYNVGGAFDETYWSAAHAYRARYPLMGHAESVSAFVRTQSAIAAPHILSALVYRFIPLQRRR